MDKRGYHLESIALVTKFAHFAQSKRLPTELFEQPDHIALHATDIKDFDRRVEEVSPASEQMIFREAHERFIVAARLAGTLSVADLGRVRWLEIIEPIQEESDVGLIGGDHVEFYYPDFGLARKVLDSRRVDYRVDDLPQPRIKVPYNNEGDEFRLTRMPLHAVIAEDLATGEAKVLKDAA